jgi:hypothetical protein
MNLESRPFIKDLGGNSGVRRHPLLIQLGGYHCATASKRGVSGLLVNFVHLLRARPDGFA